MHPRSMLIGRYPLAFCFVLAVFGCGSDEPRSEPPPTSSPGITGSAVLTDEARVLDEAALRALSRVRPDGEQVELTFSESSPILDEVEAGDVLILGVSDQTPHGALLEVESVDQQGAELVLQTRPAELGAAFEQLQVELAVTLAEPAETSGAEDTTTRGIARAEQALGLSFPIALSEGSGANRITLDGALSIDSSIDLELDFDFAELALKELSLSFGAEETFAAELVGQGQSTIDESLPLGSVSFAPITLIVPIPFPPGTLPVVLTPRVALEAGVVGSIQGEVAASVLQEASFTAGLGYRDGEFGGFSESDSSFEHEQPTYEAGVNLRAYAGPRMEVLLYGAVGPFARVDAFVELAANAGGPPPCASGVLDAGLSAKVGVDFLAEYETTLFDEREPLAQFDTCNPEPDAPRPAVTWARTFGRAGSTGETAKAVIQANDGSYLVAGDSALFDGVTGFAAAAWVLRLDPLGNPIWQRAFQRDALGLVRGVAEAPGGFVIAGQTGVIKLDSGGNLVWARSYAADEPIEIASIAAAADGSGFVVAGIHGTAGQAWAMGLEVSGAVTWSQRFAGDDFTRVRATADGGYVLLGKLADAFDASLVKLDRRGDVTWARALDNLFDANPDVPDDPLTTSDDRAFDVAEKPDGGYVVVGEGYGPYPLPQPMSLGFYSTWVADVDAQGDFTGAASMSHRAPSETIYGGAYAVAVRPNGSSLVVGRRADTAQDLLTNEDVLVIQGGSYAVLGGPGHDAIDSGPLSGNSRGMPLALTADGGAILAATSDSFAGQSQFWLVKLNRTGGIGFPHRTSVAGSSFTNMHAISSEHETSPESVPVTVTAFTSEVRRESTEATSLQQDP